MLDCFLLFRFIKIFSHNMVKKFLLPLQIWFESFCFQVLW
jgi:hypothetical protein